MDSIDFVITWVDGSDPSWRAEKEKYQALAGCDSDSRDIRYRDWNSLRFFFRGVEKFAPWVNRVFFVTYGHTPKWLNLENERLIVAKHSDFIPSEYLPTFNANTIEMHLHRIKGLAEQFVYFNDDMLIIQNVCEEDFFKNGMPCDVGVMNAHTPNRIVGNHIEIADMDIINSHFKKSEVIKKDPFKWFNLKYGRELTRNLCLLPWKEFPGLLHQHIPTSFKKSTFNTVWSYEEEILKNTSSHKFRNVLDVNQWLFEDWQRCTGCFAPRNASIGRSFSLTDDVNNNIQVFETIKRQKHKLICINDMLFGDSFEETKKQLIDSLNAIMPEKSSFEKY